MAYSEGDILVTVRGSIGPSEQWLNTWAFAPNAGTPVVADVVDDLHAMYAALAAEWFPVEFTAVGATVRYLFDSISEEAAWTTITGANVQDMLPSQLAVRASLNDNAGVNGGPFITGWSKQAAAEDGLLDSGAQTDLADAVEGLANAVQVSDYNLALHRPTVPAVNPVTRVRVGQRFDVIRKRGNDTPEAYDTRVITV